MRTRWIVVVVAGVLGGAPFAHLMAQQSGAPAPQVSDALYESQTVATALQVLARQLRDVSNVPARVTRSLSNARAEVAALDEATSRGEQREVRRHFRKATRALAVVSRFLLEREDKEASSSVPVEQRLRNRLTRLGARLSEIEQQAQELAIAADVGAARASALRGKTLLDSGNSADARTELNRLKSLLDDLDDALEDAREAFIDSQEGGL